MEEKRPIIDLHMHSSVSDGTDTPSELLQHVREEGIGIFSLTDHDSIRGAAEIRGLLKKSDPLFLSGVEFSCRDDLGKYHILGYRYDPLAGSIRDVVDLGHRYRLKKLKARLAFLRREFGFVFSPEDEKRLFELPNPGKPHIANLMVRYGFAKSRDEGIRRFLDRLHIRSEYLRPEEAISGILNAGGIPVLAHPCFGDGDELIIGDELTERVDRLVGFGLSGVEGFYSGFSEKIREQVLSVAQKKDLYVTAGSDYHGGNKLIRLADTGLTDDMPLPEGLARFLYDVFTK